MSTNIYPPSRRPCPVVTGLDDDEEEGSTGPVRCVSIASRSRELSSSKRMVSAPCIMQTPSNILLFMRTLNQHASPSASASANVPRSVSMDLARELDAEAQQAAEDEMQVRLAALRVQAIKRRLQPAVVLSICKTCGVFVCQACKEHCCKGHTVFEHKFVGSPIARECGCKFKSNSLHNLTTDQHPQCCSRASLPRHATVPAMRKLPSVPGSSDLLRHFAEKSDTTSIASTNANSEISIEGQCPTVNTPPSPTIGDISRDAPLQRMGYITAQDVCVAQTVKNSMARLKASQPTGAVGDKPNACACVVM